MKKVFKLTALLLLVGALLVGCKGNSGNKYPGNWTTTADYIDFTTGMLTGTGPSYVYKDDYTGGRSRYPSKANTFTYTTWRTNKNSQFTGFRATAKSSPADALYGFAFCISVDGNGDWSYYSIIIDSDAFMVKQQVAGVDSVLFDWESNAAIKPVVQSNEVVVYTEKNGAIKLVINGTVVKTIASPVLKSGVCGVLGPVTYEQYAAGTTVTTTYKFEEFQY